MSQRTKWSTHKWFVEHKVTNTQKLDKEEILMTSYHFGGEAFLWYLLFKKKEIRKEGKIGIKLNLKMVFKRERERAFPKATLEEKGNIK